MNYDKEFKTNEEWIKYVIRQAILQVEIYDKKEVILQLHDEKDMATLAVALDLIFYDRDDIEIYFEIKEVN